MDSFRKRAAYYFECTLSEDIAKFEITSFAAETAQKSPENRRTNRRKIAAMFRGAEKTRKRSVSAFSKSLHFRTLRYCFGRENSLSFWADTVSSAKNSMSSLLHTNNRLRGTH